MDRPGVAPGASGRKNGAAFSPAVNGDEKLVIAQEVEVAFDQALPVDEIVGIIRGEVAESHDLNVFALLLLRRGSLPKTASGKLQRQACRRFFTHGGPQVLAWWVCRPATRPRCRDGSAPASSGGGQGAWRRILAPLDHVAWSRRTGR